MTGGFISFWLVCGVVAAVVASAKNRNALGWLALGVLFPPSVLIVAVLPKLQLVPLGMRAVTCPRCNAVQNIPDGQPTFECWQCKLVSNAPRVEGPADREELRDWLNRTKKQQRDDWRLKLWL
jgi:hypothetical protein